MNLLDYTKKHHIKITALSHQTGIPYTTLGDIVNGRTDIDNASIKLLIKLSEALEMSLEDVYRLAKNSAPTPKLRDGYSLSLKNGNYFISKDGKANYLCRNTPDYALFIEDIANTYINNAERNKRMESWQTMF